MVPLLQAIWQVFLMVVRIVLFLVLFLIAISNTNPVEFHWFVDQSLTLPLNILLLVGFLLGLLIATFVLFPRKRRV
jgi:uncharacterized integral membrane protein